MKKLIYLIVLALILGLVLTGCLLSNVGQVPATEQGGITYLPKGTEAVPEGFPLFAGQDMLVGEVLVWDDGETLCVKYQLSDTALEEGWLLYETHLAVATSLEGIPTNKSGNPQVGKFPYGNDELGGVAEDGPYCIPFGDEEGELNVECGDELVIAAHAVIEKHEGCNEIGDVYGIERYSGEVYGVDVLTGETALIFTTVAPPKTNIGPNGLAYDGANRRFYYCDYQSTSTLYFWDGTQELVAGLLPGNIAAADFDDGKYYFITGPPASDNLYEVTFNADGTIAGGNTTPIADIAGNEHGWTFDGDIAVKDGVVYGWGSCGKSGHGYEFFTYDLGSGVFAWNKTAYQASLQLAFGLDGELYGHRSGNPGNFYVIDTTNGGVGSPVCNTNNILFTDCASGAICIPDIESETAWGAVEVGEIEIVVGKSWGTYFEYMIECPCEVSYPADGNVYIGYEDWPNGDFDYNDFGMYFSAVETYTGGCDEEALLTKVVMTFTASIYDSGGNHLIHILRHISGNSEVIVTRSSATGDETAGGTYPMTGDVDVVLFDTSKYGFPEKQIGEIVTVEINVADPAANPKGTLFAPRWDVNPFMQNYDPWAFNNEHLDLGGGVDFYGSEWHINTTQNVTSTTGQDPALVGMTLPHMLVIPSSDWVPPYESTTITKTPYEYFFDYYDSSGISNPTWYNEVTNSSVGSGGLSW